MRALIKGGIFWHNPKPDRKRIYKFGLGDLHFEFRLGENLSQKKGLFRAELTYLNSFLNS